LVPNVRTVAIVDDFYIVGPPEDVIKGYEEFEKLCIADGSLDLNRTKGKFLYFHPKELPAPVSKKIIDLGLTLKNKAAKVLGAPLGVDPFHMLKLTGEIVDKYQILFQRITDIRLPVFAADQILRLCGVPSLNYLTRVVPPAILKEAAQKFDGWATLSYSKKHEVRPRRRTNTRSPDRV